MASRIIGTSLTMSGNSDTTPSTMLNPSPSGLPMATTGWPCLTVSLSASVNGFRSVLATRRMARSQCASVALISVTSCFVPSLISTSSRRASPMTCRFVAIRPSLLTTKPVPSPSSPLRPTCRTLTTDGFTSIAMASTDFAAGPVFSAVSEANAEEVAMTV